MLYFFNKNSYNLNCENHPRFLNGFLLFLHITVSRVKKTVLVKGSQLTGLDYTVRSGFKNHVDERGAVTAK